MEIDNLYLKTVLEAELDILSKDIIWEIHDVIKYNNIDYNTFDILIIIRNEINNVKSFLYKDIENINILDNNINDIKNTWVKILNIFKQNIVNSNDIIKKINEKSIKNKNFDIILKRLYNNKEI